MGGPHPSALFDARINDVESAAHQFVALKKPDGCEMKDAIGSIERLFKTIGLKYISAGVENFDASISQSIVKVLTAAADEVVVDQDFADILIYQRLDGV